MDTYARFNENQELNCEIIFKKTINKHDIKTRYYVTDEDKENYYIVNKPNDIESNVVSRVSKELENKLYYLVEE